MVERQGIAPHTPVWKGWRSATGVYLSTPVFGKLESRAGVDFPSLANQVPNKRRSLRELQCTSLCGFADHCLGLLGQRDVNVLTTP